MLDDRAPYLAALVAYYAFVSLFPLLLLFVTTLGFFLDGNPHLRDQLVQAALEHFPVLGPQLRSSITGFHGSAGAVAVGVGGTLYGALGATQAAQTAFNTIYGVPRRRQPNPVRSRLRSLLLLVVLGTGVLVATALAALLSAVRHDVLGVTAVSGAAGYALSLAVNAALFTAAFQLLTAEDLRIRNVITGGLIAGALWEVLQSLASVYVTHQLRHGSSLYGAFGVVLTALAWIYLQSLVVMTAAEINVVLHRRLWPRALLTPFTDDVALTDADRRAYSSYVMAQRFKGSQSLTARYADAREQAWATAREP